VGAGAPRWYIEALFPTGYPVRVVADSIGLAVTVRGMLRLRRPRPPRRISWTDVAGARQRYRGYRMTSNHWSLVPLTDVTIDVVGPSAHSWRVLFEDDDSDTAPEAADTGAVDTQAEVLEWREYVRDLNGPDWREGTAALRFTTPAPANIVTLIEGRRRGAPWRHSP
jgi:hypothetical protein